ISGCAEIIRMPCIGDPLADVAVQVVKTELIRGKCSHWRAPPRADASPAFVVKKIGVADGNFVSAREGRSRTGTAGEFPFGLRRQAIFAASLRSQPLAISEGVMPTHANDGQSIGIVSRTIKLKIRKFGGGDGKFSKRKWLNFYSVCRAFRVVRKFII